MKLSAHFSLAEFIRSDTARQLGIDNNLPDELLPAATATAEMLERIRAELAVRLGYAAPISISSGYRCAALNAAVNSGPGSDHVRALAADFSAPAFGTPLQVCQVLASLVSVLGIGQLIYERPSPTRRWVHVGTRLPARPSNRVITIGPEGAMLGIQAG